MQKKIGVLLLCIAVLMNMVSCKDNVAKYDSNISELRTNIYSAENEKIKASAITGRRERDYKLDGQSDEKLDFTVITITPKDYNASQKYSYVAKLDAKEYKGEFLPHPFAPTLSADIPFKTDSNQIDISINCNGDTQSLSMLSLISADTISADKALTIALSKLKTSIKEFERKGKLNAEIYVRLTDNPIDNTGGYFWYVAFVGGEQKTFAVLLNSTSGEVAAIRE